MIKLLFIYQIAVIAMFFMTLLAIRIFFNINFYLWHDQLYLLKYLMKICFFFYITLGFFIAIDFMNIGEYLEDYEFLINGISIIGFGVTMLTFYDPIQPKAKVPRLIKDLLSDTQVVNVEFSNNLINTYLSMTPDEQERLIMMCKAAFPDKDWE